MEPHEAPCSLSQDALKLGFLLDQQEATDQRVGALVRPASMALLLAPLTWHSSLPCYHPLPCFVLPLGAFEPP